MYKRLFVAVMRAAMSNDKSAALVNPIYETVFVVDTP
jgi:hypothetical protein